ncbi:hypothetical protein OAP28_03815 [Planktomarina sp.]|nr:hypothetical protein [Planktomarina sp.]
MTGSEKICSFIEHYCDRLRIYRYDGGSGKKPTGKLQSVSFFVDSARLPCPPYDMLWRTQVGLKKDPIYD